MTRKQIRSRSRRLQIQIEALEGRELLTAMLGLTVNDELASFDSTRPDIVPSVVKIVGLQPGESVRAIDSRAQTGQVYGLGSTNRLYVIDPASGAVSMVGSGPIAAGLSGTSFDIEFEGGSSTLRIVSDNGINLRVDGDSAAVIIDSGLAYAPNDPGAGTTPSVVGLATTGNTPDGLGTTTFAIDAKRGVFDFVGDPSKFPYNPSNGQLVTNGPLGVAVTGPLGFEITPSGEPLVSLSAANEASSTLYSVPTTGGTLGPLQRIGSFPGAVRITDITSAPPTRIAFGVTVANRLISFNISTPGTIRSNLAITGLRDGEVVSAIAFQPTTGVLFGFGTTGRLYTINTANAVATAVSATPIAPAFDGSKPTIDFMPDTGRIRLVTQLGQDLQIDPSNGVVVAVDGNLHYVPGDSGSGFKPSIVAGVHASGTVRPGFSYNSIFGIDSGRDTLVVTGGTSAATSGDVATVGSLGRNVTSEAGLDSINGVTFALLTDPGAASAIYRIYPRVNLDPSQQLDPIVLVRLGSVGGGPIVRDMAIAPSGMGTFSATTYSALETDGVATITVVRTPGLTGSFRVTYFTSGGTASPGIDYTPVRGTLDFADGEQSKTFTVPLKAGAFPTGSRTVGLVLANDDGQGVASSTLSIVAPTSTLTPGVAGAAFHGTAIAINSVVVTFKGAVDPAKASDPANFLVQALSSARSATRSTLPITSAVYDPTTLTTTLTFATPFAFRNYRALGVTAKGFGPNGADSTAGYEVLRGVSVGYLDADGDRVILGVVGKNSRIVVLRRTDGGSASAWVEGTGKYVTGLLIPRRGSNRKAVIDKFVTGGAKLRLVRSITVTRVTVA